MENQAVILAGGRGQRLRPYTDAAPKPMLMLGSKPILEYTVANLKRNGFTDITICAGYKHEMIERHFGNGKRFGVGIAYSIEETPLGTGGALLAVKDRLKDHFVLAMADHITDASLRALYDYHVKSRSIVTIALAEISHISEYGIVDVDDNSVTGFREKPTFSNLVNTAIYAVDRKILGYIEEGDDMSTDVIPKLMESGKPVNYYVTKEFWKDIGTVKEYEHFRDSFASIEVYHNLFGGKL
jgi:mannose-1-phosphate guanylyltransferase/phosphomannomutase